MNSAKPIILSIDTATPTSAVAITVGTRENGQCLASLTLGGKVTHSRRLLSSIEWLMNTADLDWETIGGIAVSLGPGSFTGLRIGMATAKGLAAGANKSLYGVSTLDGLAAKCTTTSLICALLDARKKEVYVAFYRCDLNGKAIRQGKMAVLQPADLVSLIKEPVMMVGDGAFLYKDLFREALGEKFSLAPTMLHEPSAVPLGLIGAEKLLAGDTFDLDTGVPLYIRSSDAELSLLKSKEK